MNSFFKSFLTLRKLEYLTLDETFQVVEISAEASQFADHPLQIGVDFRPSFPELYGVESTLTAILDGKQADFELEAITRLTPAPLYFDLHVTKLETERSLLLLLEDVTERMELEQSLVQSSNETNLLLSALATAKAYTDKVITSMADAMFVTTASGRIKTVNQAAERLLHYSNAELIHQPFSMLVADENFLLQPMQPTGFAEKETLKDVEVICRTKTGEKISVAFSCSVLQSEEGLQDFIYIGRDITERQRTQQRLIAQYTTARVLSEAENLPQAAAKILPALCQNLGWDVVELWMSAAEEPQSNSNPLKPALLPGTMCQDTVCLRCVEIWSRPSIAAEEFVAVSKQTIFSGDMGLPGQVWTTHLPKWLIDVTKDAEFLRSPVAAKVGLHAAFGFPIQNGNEMLGVITFLSREIKQPDLDLLQTMVVIGNQLGQFIQRKRAQAALREQQEQTHRLLLNVLPEPIVDRLRHEQGTLAEHHAEATVLFADLVGFTQIAASLSPNELVNLLNQIFSAFDRLSAQYGLEKIKTIGDAYMVAGGLPQPRADHAQAVAEMALDMQKEIDRFNATHLQTLQMRIGIHSGPVVAGVIGIKRFIYDLWGDTVNTASRMESHGLAGRIQLTAATYQLLQDQYQFEERGCIPIKGKGEMKTYLLVGRKPCPSKDASLENTSLENI